MHQSRVTATGCAILMDRDAYAKQAIWANSAKTMHARVHRHAQVITAGRVPRTGRVCATRRGLAVIAPNNAIAKAGRVITRRVRVSVFLDLI